MLEIHGCMFIKSEVCIRKFINLNLTNTIIRENDASFIVTTYANPVFCINTICKYRAH